MVLASFRPHSDGSQPRPGDQVLDDRHYSSGSQPLIWPLLFTWNRVSFRFLQVSTGVRVCSSRCPQAGHVGLGSPGGRPGGKPGARRTVPASLCGRCFLQSALDLAFDPGHQLRQSWSLSGRATHRDEVHLPPVWLTLEVARNPGKRGILGQGTGWDSGRGRHRPRLHPLFSPRLRLGLPEYLAGLLLLLSVAQREA